MNTTDPTASAPRRTWHRHALRFALWSLASLVTLYALAFAAINWWGTRRLEQAVTRVQAAGESLDYNAMLPTPIDPATNFCAIEPLDGLTAAYETTLSPAPLGARYKVIEDSRPKPKSQFPQLGNAIVGRLSSDAEFVEKWSAWFREAMPTPLARASDNEAAIIRQGMETAYPFLKIAADAAPLRKEAQFTPALRTVGPIANPMTMRVPHLSAAQMMARTLEQHLIACIQLHDGAAALADIQALLRLSKAGMQEPTLIGHLVGMTVFSMCSNHIWACLEARLFTDSQLSTLQQEVAELDLTHSIESTLRAETAALYQRIRHFDAIGFSCDALSNEIQTQPEFMPGFIRYGLGHLIPHGLLRWRAAVYLDENLDGMLRPLRAQGLMGLFRSQSELPSSMSDPWSLNLIGAITGFVRLNTLSSSMDIARKAVTLEIVRRQALIACALERYHLQHQSYPEVLAALAPNYLATNPTDLIDAKPMRYRRTDDGRFMLWSVGLDGRDDEGKIVTKDVTRLSQLSRTEFKGDWPWLYQSQGKSEVASRPSNDATSRGLRLLVVLKKYAANHRGEYPPTLAELAKEGSPIDQSLLQFSDTGDQASKSWLYNSHLTDSSPGSDVLLASPVPLKDGTRMIISNSGEVRFVSDEEFKRLHPFR